MKQLIFILFILSTEVCYGQKQENESSFLVRNQPIELFTNLETLNTSSNVFKMNLPEADILNQTYQSDFMSFMPNDNRLINYPPADMNDINSVIFGSYMSTNFNLGKNAIQTTYIFDYTGRLVNSSTSFSFGKN